MLRPDPAAWSFTLEALGRRVYRARPLRPWHAAHYADRLARAAGDVVRIRRARWWLLRCAMPWRFSYLADDPVRRVLAAAAAVQVAAIAELLAHVTPAAPDRRHLMDHLAKHLEL